jgi:molybdopterin-guanine dinucleotide biosynthesis protein A
MGRDKATVLLAGSPLLVRACAYISGVVDLLAVSAPADSAAASLAGQLGVTCIGDPPGAPDGPLAGVLAGIGWARQAGATRLLTLPCDAPLLPADLPGRLLAALETAPCAVARTPGGVQSLCAAWTFTLEAPLAKALEGGRHPPIWRLLSDLGCGYIDYPTDEDFLNINTSEDLARAEVLLSAAGRA